MPAALMTFAHFSVSPLMKAGNSPGLPDAGCLPSFTIGRIGFEGSLCAHAPGAAEARGRGGNPQYYGQRGCSA